MRRNFDAGAMVRLALIAISFLTVPVVVVRASTGIAADGQSSHTDILLPAVGTVVSFGLDSNLPAEKIADTLFGLLQEQALPGTLSCRRLATERPTLTCLELRGEDIIHAWFDGESRILTLRLLPVTFEPGYQPDFAHFRTLEAELGRVLVSAFGAEAVVIDPEPQESVATPVCWAAPASTWLELNGCR